MHRNVTVWLACEGGLIADLIVEAYAFPLWERACSRKRWVSQYLCLLGRRLREQARSHI